VKGTVIGTTPDFVVDGVSTDTRALREGSLFVALQGPRFDAHEFLRQAQKQGARAALVSKPLPPDEVAPLVQIRVADTRVALRELAGHHARRHRARRIAVTGSNGKTTTKDLLASALRIDGATVASPRSYNNEIGVPLTLLQIEESTRFAAIEIGSNGPGQVAELAALAAPEVGIITNCSAAHLEHLHDLEGVVEEKGALIESLPQDGVAVLNVDDPNFDKLRERAPCPVVTFGVRQRADFRAIDIRFDLRRMTYRMERDRVFLPLGGCHNVYNSLAAMAAASVLGVERARVIRGLRELEGPPMRLSPIRTPRWFLLDDTYNANPGSVEAAFRTLAAVNVPGRRIAVLGDMLELGDQAGALHQRCGSLVSLTDLALLIAVGEHAQDVREGALAKGFSADRIRTFSSADEAARELPQLLQEKDTVLVKGSRAMEMEQVVEALERAGA
jgi:UDP-N-acetylmuramoyl-tripeptide--D-alanyl-D-alanine ligase